MKDFVKRVYNKELTQRQKQDLVAFEMILVKVQKDLNVNKDKLYELIGVSKSTMIRMRNGKYPVKKSVLNSLLFLAGFSYNDLNNKYIDQGLDEYVNEYGHMIINGINFGNIERSDYFDNENEE